MPSVIEAVRTCIDAGAPGITVHPRADERHITTADVHEIADELAPLRGRVEYNIEGDPRPGFLELVLAVKPDQCTLVPVKPGEITSEAGWPADTPRRGARREWSARCKAAGVRVSLFVDPEPAAIAGRRRWAPIASSCTPSRSRARSSAGPAAAAASFEKYSQAAQPRLRARRRRQCRARSRSRNLTLFQTLPHLERCRSATRSSAARSSSGLGKVVKEYLAALGGDACSRCCRVVALVEARGHAA